MQDQRFAQRPPPEWTGRPQLRVASEQFAATHAYLRDWRLVKRARFNAAKRFERKQNASTIAFAFAGIIGFLVPVYALLFKDALTAHTKNVLDFTAFITGALSLGLGLMEQAKDYPAKARRFDQCGRKVNSVLRRLTISAVTHEEELRPLVAEYEKALEECSENHDDIDRDIARAEEEIDFAKDRERSTPHTDPRAFRGACDLRKSAERKLVRLKWIERLQIYWLYGVMWTTPLAIGLMLWRFAAAD
jgi:hypothetical protein